MAAFASAGVTVIFSLKFSIALNAVAACSVVQGWLH
jgi:hypothetical protein